MGDIRSSRGITQTLKLKHEQMKQTNENDTGRVSIYGNESIQIIYLSCQRNAEKQSFK